MGSGGAESAVMSMDLKNHGHSDVTKQATTQLVQILAVAIYLVTLALISPYLSMPGKP